ncbi:MAG: flagellar biosynthetic protein FliO, partial [Nitrospinaceae bacterium]
RSAAPTGLMQAGLDGPSGDTMWGTVFKMGSTLAFVVGLMFLLFYGFKKWVLKQGVFGGKQQPIRVISTGFLGPKKSIALVEVANRVLVLGVANDHISLLSSLEDKAEIEDLLKPPPRGKKSPPPESSRRKTAPGKSPQPQAPGLRARQQILRKPNAEKEKGSFQKYVNQFSGTSPKKSRSVEDLTKMIRQQAKKVKSTV